jgi:hypothetical protein
MDKINDDMYFYLDSSKSKEYYPTNSSASFTNVLPNELSFEEGKWEAGVVWIQFFDKYEETVNPAAADNKFFGHTDRDNILTIRENSPITLQMLKTDIGVDTFISQLNSMLRRWSSLEIQIRLRNEGLEQYIAIGFNPMPNGKLTLSPELAHVLGFSIETIRSTSTGDHPIDEEFYNSLPIDTVFAITYSVDTVKEVEIPEPREYNFESLVEAYSAPFYTQYPNTSILYSFEKVLGDYYMKIRIENPNMSLQFPRHINLLLGLDQNEQIKGERSFLLPSNMDYPATIVPQQVILMSHLVKESYIYGRNEPVLRVFKREAIKEYQIHSFDSVLYVPLRRNDIASISLCVYDNNFELIPKTDQHTTALIHVRPKHG